MNTALPPPYPIRPRSSVSRDSDSHPFRMRAWNVEVSDISASPRPGGQGTTVPSRWTDATDWSSVNRGNESECAGSIFPFSELPRGGAGLSEGKCVARKALAAGAHQGAIIGTLGNMSGNQFHLPA